MRWCGDPHHLFAGLSIRGKRGLALPWHGRSGTEEAESNIVKVNRRDGWWL